MSMSSLPPTALNLHSSLKDGIWLWNDTFHGPVSVITFTGQLPDEVKTTISFHAHYIVPATTGLEVGRPCNLEFACHFSVVVIL